MNEARECMYFILYIIEQINISFKKLFWMNGKVR